MNVYEIVSLLAKTPASTLKREIIRDHADNEVWRKVLFLAYSPTVTFYVTPPRQQVASLTRGTSLSDALEILVDQFATRALTGNAARDRLVEVLCDMDPEDQLIFLCVIGRDLRCGINVSLINKAIPDLIPTFDFLLADTDLSGITWPAISQLKADGVRSTVHQSFTGQVTFITRSGKTVDLHGVMDEAIRAVLNSGESLDGELVCYDENGPLPRKISNGIINKALKGTISIDEAKLVRFLAWDVVDKTGTIPYTERFDDLADRVLKAGPGCPVIVIESKVASTYEEALDHYKDVRRRGLEGTIVKNTDGVWVPRRSKDLCKFKAEIEGEFRVTGYTLGTGKNANRIGNLIIESADGLVKSEVGIFKGFPESVRDEWLEDLPKIVTVLYNERITAADRDTESLFLPRVTAVRLDKDEANTRDELIAIEESILK